MNARKAIPALVAVASIILCFVFSRYYLSRQARTFEEQFQHQNYAELSTDDSFALSQRLNSLGESESWVCILGFRNRKAFFEKRAGNCSPGLLRESAIVKSASGEIELRFILQLPVELTAACGVFILLQAILLFSLARAARAQERDRLELRMQLASLAAQVAHDIRSPLAALKAAESDLAALPEDTRIMVRSAIGRIQDIANHLLEKNRASTRATDSPLSNEKNSSELTTTNEPSSPTLLSSLLEAIVTEKRMQYRSSLGIEIELSFQPSSYGLFGLLQPNEFKRVISNLVNNAVESFLNGSGKVLIAFESTSNQVHIRVSDNGKGIPQSLLGRLTQKGETHGKIEGSGLGLYHARTSLESWDGALVVESQLGKGTSVILTLPLCKSPPWFVDQLKIKPRSQLVIVDDDQSIHQIWQGRMDSLRTKEHDIELLHFSTPGELRAWRQSIDLDAATSAFCLVDYELLGFQESGLDLIEALGLSGQSILVTSRYEEPAIRSRCAKLGISLIPKGMAGFVPIHVERTQTKADAVLIDDDVLVHMSWKMDAKAQGKQILTFKSALDFIAVCDTIEKTTPIYVDSHLGDGLRGEDWIKMLHARGFTALYLATGYPAERFAGLPFILGVRGKEAPCLDVTEKS